MNKKSFLFAFVGLFFSVNGVFAEKVYKEIVIDGEKVNKWMEVDSITEYDQQEREVHKKEKLCESYTEYKDNYVYITSKYDFDDGEIHENFETRELNKRGDIIYQKSEKLPGHKVELEVWNEYNARNLHIHRMFVYYQKNGKKDSWETWFKYDENGNVISDSDGNYFQYEKNKLVHSKAADSCEKWFSYDENGQKKYEKNYGYTRRGTKYGTEEYWYEYNNKNDIVHKKYKIDLDGIEISNFYYTYDYEYYPNGKLKKKTTYSCRG